MRVNFVNQVSHELKTPLTNIQLYAEMLKESASEDDPLVSSRLDIVLSESRWLSRMITNILIFAKRTRSKLTIRPVATCVDDTIENVVEQCRLSLEKRGIGAIEVEKGAGRDITADPDAVGQIIANLIGNV
jgi:signal transduction histidine kinase